MAAPRMWRLSGPIAAHCRALGYPESVPYTGNEDSFDYCGPVWDHTQEQRDGGVWSMFRLIDGRAVPTYQGGGGAYYRLDNT